jgi:anti-anti-sigma regulatory factor
MIQKVEAGRDLGPQALTDLGKALPELFSQGVTVLSMDASKVTEFDSQSLEALLEFDALVRSRGLEFQLSAPSEVLALALSVTGLSERLDVVDRQPETLPEQRVPAP